MFNEARGLIMSKISQYLNEHLLGEVTSAEQIRHQFSHDGSVLTLVPELVVHPRLTNDIRKIARFTWQLAEKGHIMPITIRGGGTDLTGAAIGKGIVINTLAHLNNIIFINLKDKDQFVHCQPGVNFGTLNEALKTHGMFIPAYPSSFAYSTIGGAVANNASGPLSGTYGPIGDAVSRLEVVLANGDILETGRISKHELVKKKGLQTLEGEIYRKLDGIIEDNAQLIADKIATKPLENCGYSGIAKVKEKNGSFDLTPLLIGSQGTLGVISELVVKTQFYNSEESISVISFTDAAKAREACNLIKGLKPIILDYIDNDLFDIARAHGKKFIFDKSCPTAGVVIYISFGDFSAKARAHKMKHLNKIISKFEATIFTSNEYANEELRAIREVSSTVIQPETKDESFPSLIDGSSVPIDCMPEFIAEVEDLSKRDHIKLPLQINWLNGIINAKTPLQLHITSDKQKLFKLIADYAELVYKHNGNMLAASSEGRLKTSATYGQLDENVLALYEQIKTVFDPFATLNPGVKQETTLKTLISQLNPSYNLADISKHSPYF